MVLKQILGRTYLILGLVLLMASSLSQVVEARGASYNQDYPEGSFEIGDPTFTDGSTGNDPLAPHREFELECISTHRGMGSDSSTLYCDFCDGPDCSQVPIPGIKWCSLTVGSTTDPDPIGTNVTVTCGCHTTPLGDELVSCKTSHPGGLQSRCTHFFENGEQLPLFCALPEE